MSQDPLGWVIELADHRDERIDFPFDQCDSIGGFAGMNVFNVPVCYLCVPGSKPLQQQWLMLRLFQSNNQIGRL